MKKLLLFLGVFIVSFSGIMIKVSDSNPISISFYRCLIASFLYITALKWKFKLFDFKKEILLLISGTFVALHFYFWISSFRHTTIAGAVIPLMVQPFFTSLLSFLIYNEKVSLKEIFSTLTILLGVIIMTTFDAKISLELSFGDVLSLIGTLFLCGFITVGRFIIPIIGTLNFNMRSYLIASAFLFFLSYQEIFRFFPIKEWVIFWGLGGGCSFLGYTLINNSLKFFKAGTVSIALVGEPVLSIVWAWILFGEIPTFSQIIGLLTSILGIISFFRSKL
ncbi:MAG: DMT family transporter [Synergistetes bacterium]|nr:DMT family transporter [Synergistota bacterium]MCX8127321.1 DMT family transporter [Synergistota bacterium]MDW8191792.1 DMT family transporter [Synergistota bacterium]